MTGGNQYLIQEFLKSTHEFAKEVDGNVWYGVTRAQINHNGKYLFLENFSAPTVRTIISKLYKTHSQYLCKNIPRYLPNVLHPRLISQCHVQPLFNAAIFGSLANGDSDVERNVRQIILHTQNPFVQDCMIDRFSNASKCLVRAHEKTAGKCDEKWMSDFLKKEGIDMAIRRICYLESFLKNNVQLEDKNSGQMLRHREDLSFNL